MQYTRYDVEEFVREQDVKFVRLAFCDIFGNQKNLSVVPAQLAKAFDYGISFDASAVKGFMNVENSDLLLKPDPATMSVLPWRSHDGTVIRMFCDIYKPDGTPFTASGRYILKKACEHAREMGYTCHIGTECEFYLFLTVTVMCASALLWRNLKKLCCTAFDRTFPHKRFGLWIPIRERSWGYGRT